jgi:K+-sensing histidine kinase KdpD
VIEDALDMTRLESGKFKIFKEFFNLRNVIKEIDDIMKF